MKKTLMILAALFTALILACSAVAAESAGGGLGDYLARIADPADPVVYTLSTTEYGPLEPGDCPADSFIELLQQATFEPAEPAETPEGEYVVLAFPEDGVRFDFFQGKAEDNYFRKVAADESEELFRAVMPEGVSDISGIMNAWYDSIADSQGLVPPIEAKMPDAGWVRDSLTKCNWVCDRAGLEVFLEDTENYKVLISWSSSAWETTEWTFACDYDPAADVLLARNAVKDQVTYGDDGQEVDRKTEYERESEAVFFVNDRGQLVILNAGDEALAELIFERVMNENQGDAGVTEWNLPESTEVTADLKAEFDKAMAGLLGVNYEPVAFLADKDGVNCFLARCTAVYPDAKPYYALVYMNDEGVKNVWDVWLDAHANP